MVRAAAERRWGIGRMLLAATMAGTWAAFPQARAGEEPFVAHGGPAKDIEYDAASRTLLSAGFDYSLVLWDPDTGTVRARLVAHDGPLNDVAVVADEGLAVTASDDGTVGVADTRRGRMVARLRGHEAKVVAVAAAADGRRVASAGWDGTVRVWSLPGGSEVARFGDPSARYTGVAFVSSSRLAASDQNGGLTLWDLENGGTVWKLAGNGFPITRLLARGDMLFTGAIDGTIRGWAAADGGELFRLEGQEKPVLSLALSADGQWLASGTAAGTVYLWQVAEQRGERVLRAEGGPAWSLAFGPEGRLFSGHADGAIRVWDPRVGRQLAGPAALRLAATDRLIEGGRGAALFRKCVGCHSVTPDDENKAGPTFYHLIGRPAGAVPGYPYSPALRRSGIVWTEETLSRLFELGPERFLPGTRMPLQRMPDPEDRAELVAYIARIAGGDGTGRETGETRP